MADPDPAFRNQHTDHIEAILLARSTISLDPRGGRADQVVAFLPVNGLDRITEPHPASRLHLHECHQAVSLRDEVDVAPA